MVEVIILGVLLAGALFYLGKKLRRSTRATGGCGKDCGCGDAGSIKRTQVGK